MRESDAQRQERERIQYELQGNLLAEQRAIIEMGKAASRKPEVIREVVHVKTESPVSQQIQRDNRRLESSLSYAREAVSDLQDTINTQTKNINEYKQELQEQHQEILELRKKLNQSYKDRNTAQERYEQTRIELEDLKREIRLSGLAKEAPAPKTFTRPQSSLQEAPIQPQTYSYDPESPLNRWIMEKSLEQSKHNRRQEIYTPTNTEIEKINFMTQHGIVRMDQYEIPSLQQHQENTKEWMKMS
jgi:chromosome segregation ATPase